MSTETESASAKTEHADQADLEQSSLFDYTPGEPYEYLDELREKCPVHWDPKLRGYFMTKYEDVFEVMSDAERFRLKREQYEEHQPMSRVATFRKMLSGPNLEPYRETIFEPELDRLMAKFEQAGRVEVFSQVADPFPAHVIALLFGLEGSDFADLIGYRDARSAVFNSSADAPDAEELIRVSAEWQEKIDARMREVLEDHRANPADDLTTFLLNATEDGEPIPDEQIMQIAVRDILMAGSETSARSICNAVYRMLTVPGIYEQLLADRSLVRGFVEESLRYDPPVHIFWRAPNEDVELSGCPIAKDKQIYTSIAGANRDPAKFERPNEFDINRGVGRHITFSAGPHRCPGSYVGRAETEMVIIAFLERLPNLRLDPDAPQPELQEVVLRNWRPLHLLFEPA